MHYIFWMNEAPHLLMENDSQEGGWGGWRAWKVQDCKVTDPSFSPEPRVWLGLGNKITLVKVREILWFDLKLNKLVVPEVNYKTRIQTLSNLTQMLWEPKTKP